MIIFQRVLLAVYAVFLTAASLITMIMTMKHDVFDRLSNYIRNEVLISRNPSIALFFIALIFFGVSLTFLLSGLRSSKEKKSVNKNTSIGEVRISLDAVENIALAAAKRIGGLKDTKAQVIKSKDDESVKLVLRTVVFTDTNIPAISEDLQTRVKKAIEESSGIGVQSVKVMVENTYTGYRSRVE